MDIFIVYQDAVFLKRTTWITQRPLVVFTLRIGGHLHRYCWWFLGNGRSIFITKIKMRFNSYAAKVGDKYKPRRWTIQKNIDLVHGVPNSPYSLIAAWCSFCYLLRALRHLRFWLIFATFPFCGHRKLFLWEDEFAARKTCQICHPNLSNIFAVTRTHFHWWNIPTQYYIHYARAHYNTILYTSIRESTLLSCKHRATVKSWRTSAGITIVVYVNLNRTKSIPEMQSTETKQHTLIINSHGDNAAFSEFC